MTIARHYIATSKPGSAAAMDAALRQLAEVVRTLPGSLGFEILQDIEDENRFVFIEKWVDVDAHKAALVALPNDAFAAFGEALAEPPVGSYLDHLASY